jgi:all-beta uncharacterized protein/BACON domain-containing protein
MILATWMAFRERPRVLVALGVATIAAACGATSTTTTGVGPTPPKCAVSVTAPQSAIDAAGGAGSIAVATQPECTWTASTDANWISALSPASGQGNADVAFQAAPNPDGVARQGGVIVSEQRATISQAAAPCRFDLAESRAQVPATGGTATVAVAAPNGCSWQASSSSAWLSVTAGNSGNGNGTVTFTAASNPGIARTGLLVIEGQSFTVSQAAAIPVSECEYVIQPTTASLPAAGGGGTVAVNAATGCVWNATASASWIAITSGASGSGAGSVRFSVGANAGSARTGNVSIAGEQFSITQDGNCSVSIAPTSQSVGAAGGAGTPIAVATTTGCTWTVASAVPWLAIASATSGSGNGNVTFSIAANTSIARVGTLLIGDRVFTVNQAGTTCAFSINPTSRSVGAAGGAGTAVNVSTTSECAWSASSNAPWITVTSGATGMGPGNVNFSVAANTGAGRNGTLTIAGQTFTVTQAANCTYSIAPTSQSIAGGAGTGTPIAVSTSTGCSWTAAGNVSWIAIASGSTGSGNGSVTFTVAANAGAARTGTLTVAGQTFTVTQAADCSYTISPSSKSFSDKGGDGTSSVSAPSSCSWTAASNAPWITVTAGASGSGNGKVTFKVAENRDTFERIGTLTIAGKTFTVTQAKH